MQAYEFVLCECDYVYLYAYVCIILFVLKLFSSLIYFLHSMLVPHIHFIFYVAPYYAIIWILCDIFHQSSLNECFGYFCFLIIINSTPANILECRLLRTCSNISVGKILKTGTGSQRLYLFEVWCVLSDHPPKVLEWFIHTKKV